jgi:predicted nucleotidyltransferase
MNHGLPEATVAKICAILARFPAVEKAVLYGSRAKGTYKPGSDIDLTLLGNHLSSATLGTIADQLDDLLLPYQIDLSIFDQIDHEGLREHIQRVGQVFYRKNPGADHG